MAGLGPARRGLARRGSAWPGKAWFIISRNKDDDMGTLEASYKDGFPSRGTDPQKVYEEIQIIRSKNDGRADEDQIVAAAAKKRSAMNPFFDWDDTDAAREWRRQQAGRLATAIVVLRDENHGKPSRAFSPVTIQIDGTKRPRGKGLPRVYGDTVEVLDIPEENAAILARLGRDLKSLLDRYEWVAELSGIEEALSTALDRANTAARALNKKADQS